MWRGREKHRHFGSINVEKGIVKQLVPELNSQSRQRRTMLGQLIHDIGQGRLRMSHTAQDDQNRPPFSRLEKAMDEGDGRF